MLKITSLLLIAALFLTGTINAQTLTAATTPANNAGLRQAFAAETAEIKAASNEIDEKQMNRMPRQQTQNNWSGTKTALVVVLAVVIVGALYVIVKNTKRCVERRPSGCDLVNDPDCVCVREER